MVYLLTKSDRPLNINVLSVKKRKLEMLGSSQLLSDGRTTPSKILASDNLNFSSVNLIGAAALLPLLPTLYRGMRAPRYIDEFG